MIAWKEETQSYQIRTVSKIQAGEEICINYICGKSMFMKNARTRQRRLLIDWGFECKCSLCIYENANPVSLTQVFLKEYFKIYSMLKFIIMVDPNSCESLLVSFYDII